MIVEIIRVCKYQYGLDGFSNILSMIPVSVRLETEVFECMVLPMR